MKKGFLLATGISLISIIGLFIIGMYSEMNLSIVIKTGLFLLSVAIGSFAIASYQTIRLTSIVSFIALCSLLFSLSSSENFNLSWRFVLALHVAIIALGINGQLLQKSKSTIQFVARISLWLTTALIIGLIFSQTNQLIVVNSLLFLLATTILLSLITFILIARSK